MSATLLLHLFSLPATGAARAVPGCGRYMRLLLEVLMFSVSEYFDRTEKASLEILETMEPIDKTITLWWGFDGIRLSEDGTFKWVSRRKKPVENVFYQPCQSIQWTMPYTVSIETGMERMQTEALQTKLVAARQQQQRIIMIQKCCVISANGRDFTGKLIS